MELNEAINIAEQMTNHYQAFSKILEVLDTARNLTNAISELKQQIQSLQDEVNEKKSALVEVENLIVAKNNEYSMMVAEYSDKLEVLKREEELLTKRIGNLQEIAKEIKSKLAGAVG